MKQPYTYSMPESFLKDKSVPARWRVLGVINGFILNGGCFYGSNEWLMEQLGCSEPTISSAFQELEELGEIRTERTKRTRKVYKTTRDPRQFGSETQVEPVRDPSQLVPNSVSNSVKESSASEDGQRGVSKPTFGGEGSEEEPRTKSKPKYPNAKTVFSWFPSQEKSWVLNSTELKHAELLFIRGEEAVRGILAFVTEHRGDEFFPKVSKPSDLERKWKDIVDFANRNGL